MNGKVYVFPAFLSTILTGP